MWHLPLPAVDVRGGTIPGQKQKLQRLRMVWAAGDFNPPIGIEAQGRRRDARRRQRRDGQPNPEEAAVEIGVVVQHRDFEAFPARAAAQGVVDEVRFDQPSTADLDRIFFEGLADGFGLPGQQIADHHLGRPRLRLEKVDPSQQHGDDFLDHIHRSGRILQPRGEGVEAFTQPIVRQIFLELRQVQFEDARDEGGIFAAAAKRIGNPAVLPTFSGLQTRNSLSARQPCVE